MKANSDGFSMIELLVSIAMIAVISYSAIGLTDFYSQSIGRNNSRFGQLRLVDEMRSVVTTRETCLGSLLERDFQPSRDSDMRVQLISGGVVSSSPGERDQKAYGVEVRRLILTNKRQLAALPSGETIYSTQLRLETEVARTVTNHFKMSRPVASLTLKIDPSGRISDCMLGETPLDAQALACQAMGGDLIGGNCQLHARNVEVMCPDGQHLVGFGQEGGPICEPVRGPPPAPVCEIQNRILGAGTGATPRFWGGFACNQSCIGSYGPGATCAGGCYQGYRGWMYCGNCTKATKVCL